MKKFLVILMACLTVLAVSSCKDKKAQEANARLKAQNDSLIATISKQGGQVEDLMGTISQVQEGFRQIDAAEGRLDMHQGAAENSQSVRQSLAADIEFIKTTMQQNKERLAGLRENLKHNNNISVAQLAKLQKLVDSLDTQLAQQQKESNQKIKELQDELAAKNVHIAELDKSVSALTTDNESKSKVMAQQDKDLNKAWYVFGTKKELKEQGILEGNKLMKGDFNKNYFMQVDIRSQKEIKLYAKSAKLLTVHPAGSYELVRDEKKDYTLRIISPTEFWSVSKFLVILVDKVD